MDELFGSMDAPELMRNREFPKNQVSALSVCSAENFSKSLVAIFFPRLHRLAKMAEPLICILKFCGKVCRNKICLIVPCIYYSANYSGTSVQAKLRASRSRLDQF